MELRERSEVLLPSFPLHSFPLPFSPLLSLTLPSPPLSGGNNFNNFPENQLTQILHFSASLLGGMLLYHRSPCPDIIWGNGVPPPNIWGERYFPRVHHCRLSTHNNCKPAVWDSKLRLWGILSLLASSSFPSCFPSTIPSFPVPLKLARNLRELCSQRSKTLQYNNLIWCMHPVSTSAVSRGKKCVKQPALSSNHSVGHVPCLLKVYSFAPGYTRVLTVQQVLVIW